jgi:hypothetical protein
MVKSQGKKLHARHHSNTGIEKFIKLSFLKSLDEAEKEIIHHCSRHRAKRVEPFEQALLFSHNGIESLNLVVT